MSSRRYHSGSSRQLPSSRAGRALPEACAAHVPAPRATDGEGPLRQPRAGRHQAAPGRSCALPRAPDPQPPTAGEGSQPHDRRRGSPRRCHAAAATTRATAQPTPASPAPPSAIRVRGSDATHTGHLGWRDRQPRIESPSQLPTTTPACSLRDHRAARGRHRHTNTVMKKKHAAEQRHSKCAAARHDAGKDSVGPTRICLPCIRL